MSFFSAVGHALKSRTVWAGIGTTVLGAAQLGAQVLPTIAPYIPAGTPVGAGITVALGIGTIVARLRARQPLGPVVDDTIAATVDAVHQIQGNAPPTAAKVASVSAIVKNQPPPPPLGSGA